MDGTFNSIRIWLMMQIILTWTAEEVAVNQSETQSLFGKTNRIDLKYDPHVQLLALELGSWFVSN